MQLSENSRSRLTKNRQNLFPTLLATIIAFCLVALPCMARPVELSQAKSDVEVILSACDSDEENCDCDSVSIGKTAAERPWVIEIPYQEASSCSTKAQVISGASTKLTYADVLNIEKDTKDASATCFAGSASTFKSPKGYGTLVLNWEVQTRGGYDVALNFDENSWFWSRFVQQVNPPRGAASYWTYNPGGI